MNLDDKPLVSIVIPTQNRHAYLKYLLQRLLLLEHGVFEIVVHDNSPNSMNFEAHSLPNDSRLVYVHDPRPMSLVENFERSVQHASGTFICMIGDDDGVTSELFTLARWMKQHQIHAAALNPANYLWPGVESVLEGKQSVGILRIPAYSAHIELVETSEALDGVLSSGGIRIGNLPRLYHGLVSRSAIEELTKLAGTPFPGPSPDMANAIALTAVVTHFVRVSFPVVIAGTCTASAAAEGARHKHVGEISERKFLPPNTAALWPDLVPKYFSGPTLWAATLLLALDVIGRTDLKEKFRYDRLYAACCIFAPQYRSRVRETCKRHPTAVPRHRFFLAMCWVWLLRARALVRNLMNKSFSIFSSKQRIPHVDDIGLAITLLRGRTGEIPIASFEKTWLRQSRCRNG